MERLVNYSSEDEQEERNYKKMAERGSPRILKRAISVASSDSSSESSMSPTQYPTSSTAGRGSRCGAGNISGGDGNYYKGREENSRKYGTSAPNSGNRSTSSYYNRDNAEDNNRESRDNRDKRNGKDFRDGRNYSNSDKYDNRGGNERNRTKDYKNDYNKRDNDYSRDGRRPRDNDHGHTTRHSSSTAHHKDRYNHNARDEGRARYSDSSKRAYRSYDERSERYERSEQRPADRYRRHGDLRSPSPPHHRNKRSRHYQTRDSRSRTRSRTRSRSSSPHQRSAQPLEQARMSALEMERKLNVNLEPNKIDLESPRETTLHNIKPLVTLPLSDNAPKQPSVIAVACTRSATSSASHSIDPAVIQLPSYYNPNVINPNKYAEQVQKRKLLWGAKKTEDVAAKWGNAQFSQDSDGKVASKFMRLMGIKDAAVAATTKTIDSIEVEKKAIPSPDVKSREAMFSSMEQQYEVARQVTHTMRGVGLGFSSQSRPF